MPIFIPTTVNATGQPPIAGNVVLAAGTNVTLTQTGNKISIAAAGGSAGNWPTIQNRTLVTDIVTIAAGFQMLVVRNFTNLGSVINNGDFAIL